jgi:hypothetical protein
MQDYRRRARVTLPGTGEPDMLTFRLYVLCLLLINPTSVLKSREPATPQTTRAISESGNVFVDFCKHFDDVENSRYVLENGVCIGWVQGFTQGVTVTDEFLQTSKEKRMMCPPDEVTFGQYTRVIYKYISDHPERAHMVTRYLASEALIRAFPCSK